ncbi:MAG: D-cysteine desulfhydrase family protein [Pseudomonadota bacterium]
MSFGRLRELPRAKLWSEPTPVELLHNLAEQTGAAKFYVKRDDCNGLAFGGNKVRQMEYYLGDAINKGADTLLITGAVQSNFVRTAAAGCAKLGLECHVQLENRVTKDTQDYRQSGNVLLDRMLGAVIHEFPQGEDEAGADANLETIADGLRKDGRQPYVVHLHPSHPPFGALGYIDCAIEIVEQIEKLDVKPDCIFTPSGSGNTHGGLLYGLRQLECDIPVTGVCVRRESDLQRLRIIDRLTQIAELLEQQAVASVEDVFLTDAFLAPGYGVAGPQANEAIALAAQKEALILDPVYTSKTFAAAINFARNNPGANLLVIHTGGGPSVFGYKEDMLSI